MYALCLRLKRTVCYGLSFFYAIIKKYKLTPPGLIAHVAACPAALQAGDPVRGGDRVSI
jgi:hypothetical protein